MANTVQSIIRGTLLTVKNPVIAAGGPTIKWRRTAMRKAMPRITESANALQHRMQSERELKKRQRRHALYLAASGQARHRQEIEALLGVHRPSVATLVWIS